MIEIITSVEGISKELENAIELAANTALELEGKSGNISIAIVDDDEIWRINREFRSVDRPTDVLSFPAREGEDFFTAPDGFIGDIAISLPTAKRQAEEYGHSLLRELSFLTIHGVLHILGYDHMEKADETVMLEHQKRVLSSLKL